MVLLICNSLFNLLDKHGLLSKFEDMMDFAAKISLISARNK